MKVIDVLEKKGREVITTTASTPLPSAMETLIKRKISCLPVLNDNDELIGIVSDKDIFHAIHENPHTFTSMKVSDLMTIDVIVGLHEDELDYIAGIMTYNRVRHVPIVEGKKIVGLLSIGDIVKARMKNMEFENRYLKQYIDGTYPA